jgi:hypothetical protein
MEDTPGQESSAAAVAAAAAATATAAEAAAPVDVTVMKHALALTSGDSGTSAKLIASCRSALRCLRDEDAEMRRAAAAEEAVAGGTAANSSSGSSNNSLSSSDAMWLAHVGSESQVEDMQVRAGPRREDWRLIDCQGPLPSRCASFLPSFLPPLFSSLPCR